MHEEYRWGNRGLYIVGVPGHFVVKSCGNNRILTEEFKTINEARFWLTTMYPGVKLYSH